MLLLVLQPGFEALYKLQYDVNFAYHASPRQLYSILFPRLFHPSKSLQDFLLATGCKLTPEHGEHTNYTGLQRKRWNMEQDAVYKITYAMCEAL